jgi:hypothetical protein
MKNIIIALGWAAGLILLPFAARRGLVDIDTIKTMTPMLTVLAVLHLTARNHSSRCLPRCSRGAV